MAALSNRHNVIKGTKIPGPCSGGGSVGTIRQTPKVGCRACHVREPAGLLPRGGQESQLRCILAPRTVGFCPVKVHVQTSAGRCRPGLCCDHLSLGTHLASDMENREGIPTLTSPQFLMLDPTPETWCYFGLARRAGLGASTIAPMRQPGPVWGCGCSLSMNGALSVLRRWKHLQEGSAKPWAPSLRPTPRVTSDGGFPVCADRPHFRAII